MPAEQAPLGQQHPWATAGLFLAFLAAGCLLGYALRGERARQDEEDEEDERAWERQRALNEEHKESMRRSLR